MKKLLLLMFAASFASVSCQRGLESEFTSAPLTLSVSELSYEDGTLAGILPPNQTDPATGLYAQWGRVNLPVSRADDGFQTGEDIGIYIHSAELMDADNIHSTNMRYVTSDKGATWGTENAMSGALTASAYFATAYHPYQATISDIMAVPHTVLTNQSAAEGAVDENLEKSDFMSVNNAVVSDISTSPAATLNFAHRMSKFQIKINIPSTIDGLAVTALKSVTIKGLKDKGTINLTNGAATVSDVATDEKDITPRQLSGTNAAGTTSTFEAVVFPQTVAAENVLVEFAYTVAGNGEQNKTLNYVVPAESTLSFQSGKRLILTLSSPADVAFMSDLDLTDGLAKTAQPLTIKVPSNAAWTLTSPEDWLMLSLTEDGAYAKEINGTGTGEPQTIYVNVTANDTEDAEREANLILAAITTPASAPVTYSAVQGYAPSSSDDVAFTGDLDFGDDLPQTAQPLTFKVQLGAPWTLTSSEPWLTLSTSAASTYGTAVLTKSSYGTTVSGVGTGELQTVYVSATANDNEQTEDGRPTREATLTLAATTVPASEPVSYSVVQGYTARDIIFLNELNLLDGLAKTDQPLTFKVPSGIAWTLTSEVDWLTLSTSVGDTYGATVSGTGTGAEQTVYVNVTTYDTDVFYWRRYTSLSLSAATTPMPRMIRYFAIQNHTRAYVKFTGSLDLSDGLAKTSQLLLITVFPYGATYTLTSSVDWMTFSLTPDGTYSKEINGLGTGQGANFFPTRGQAVYVSVTANDTETATGWQPREATLSLSVTSATSASVPVSASYSVVQGYSRYEVSGNKSITLISNTPSALPSMQGGRIWKLSGTIPSWLKITSAPVAWSATNSSNTITVTAAGCDIAAGVKLYAVADPNTLGVIGGTLANGLTSATASLLYEDTPVTVHWTHSFKNTNVAERPLVWAAGNLVSTNTTEPNTFGQGGARIGSMYDGGLYFKFSSLVGFKGGANGSGVGDYNDASKDDLDYWLRPTGSAVNVYRNVNIFETDLTLCEFNALVVDNVTVSSVGDACRYYLGSPWRLPTAQEYGDLCNKQYQRGLIPFEETGGVETNSTTIPATELPGSWWSGTASSTASLTSSVYFGRFGVRLGIGRHASSQGSYCTSSISWNTDKTAGLFMHHSTSGSVATGAYENPSFGASIRCVQ